MIRSGYQNVANSSRRALQEAEKSVREFDLEAESGTLAQALVGETIREPEDAKEDEPAPADVAKSEFIASKSLFPIDPEAIRGKTWRRFGFSIAAGRAWNKCIWNLVTAYSAAVTISQERFPLLRTYDAAVSELNRYYSQQLADGELLPVNNIPFQEFALLKAKATSGFPAPPKAHLRFRVEAFWTTIDARFKVAAVIESLTLHPNLRNSRIVEGLRAFNSFLMDCVQHDAQRAIDLSEESQSQRQVLRSALLLMRAEWQAFAVKATSLGPRERNPPTIRDLIEKAEAGCIKAKQTIESRRRTFVEKMGGHPDDQTWAYENFVQPAEEIVDRWVNLKTQIQETSYGLSDEEKRQIIQALVQGNGRELPISQSARSSLLPRAYVDATFRYAWPLLSVSQRPSLRHWRGEGSLSLEGQLDLQLKIAVSVAAQCNDRAVPNVEKRSGAEITR